MKVFSYNMVMFCNTSEFVCFWLAFSEHVSVAYLCVPVGFYTN